MKRKMEPDEIAIRPYRPGDAGCVDYLHMKLYQNTYGFKPVFEYYVLKGLAEFLRSPDGGMLWVAEDGDEIIGSVAIVKTDVESAQLRWFLLDERYHGLGLGKRLMSVALAFCKERRYKQVSLWTVDFLHAARHLYASSGFHLTETKENDEWTDRTIKEELWILPLA